MKILSLNSRSVTIELENSYPYYNTCEFDIYLNDAFIKKENRNVFTLFDLTPNTSYNLKAVGEISFKTPDETTIYLDDFSPFKDGIHDDTIKIQSAIMSSPFNSTIVVSEGTYLVTSIYLKSNINIYLKKGAKFILETNRTLFPVHPKETGVGIWEGSEVNNFASMINIIDSKNVTIYGEGLLDGRAEESDWYINHRVMNIAWRGHMLFISRSENINIIGPSFKNSPAWTIHPYRASYINFYNISINNNKNMPTTDGIDPDMSDHLEIKGCYFSLGDDCIAIKSGTYELAKKLQLSSHHILIENNLMEEGHGGVVFGSESSGGIQNVSVSKCIFKNTDRGLRIKTRRGRGNIGSIDHILFDNIYMENVLTPFVINSYYNMGPKGGHEEYVWSLKKQEVNEYTPILKDFSFKNMECKNVGYAAAVILGLPEMPIEKVLFENISFSYNLDSEEGIPCMMEHPYHMKNKGIFCLNVKELITKNVKFINVSGNEIEKEWTE